VNAGAVICLILVVLLYVWMARAGRKPRTEPKVPRNHRSDARWFFYIGLR